ncbi:MAG: transcription elongation factor GreA [Gammaproteobacteria bacterium]|jgi:transcription elongation factor GreA
MNTPLTLKGAERLRETLRKLKSVDRPKIIEAIAEARSHGDLSENAEYHAAKEQQGFTEGRIAALESVLSMAQIIDVLTIDAGDKVVFGATVKLKNFDNETEVTYQIVGEEEADINLGLISITSPIAKALIGKELNDCVDVHAPSGIIEYEILEISYI